MFANLNIFLLLVCILVGIGIGWFLFCSRSKEKRLFMSLAGLFKIEMSEKPVQTAPEKEVSSLIRESQKFSAPHVKEEVEKNVAKNKPVAYLEIPILLENGRKLDQSLNHERYSVNAGLYPSRLTDGSPSTYAYPAAWAFDYIVDLKELQDIEKVVLSWGIYGEEPVYITKWWLYSQKRFDSSKPPSLLTDWEPVASGGFPNSFATTIQKAFSATRLRVIAVSADFEKKALLNWIGMVSVNVYGKEQ
ncbi:MAG: hypothetical protein AB1512_07075 [Thermodesulfobacteriota bacterium]